MPPLREPTYFTLAALLNGPKHGYAILQQVLDLSQGRVRLSTGTLYGALDRLAGQGLIEAGPAEVVGGRTRRSYTLTTTGRAAVLAEADRMAAAARVVTQTLRPAAAPGGQRGHMITPGLRTA